MKRLLKIAASIVVCFALIFSVSCKGADGAAGNGIKSAVMEDGRLILILDDGSRLDLGSISAIPERKAKRETKATPERKAKRATKAIPGRKAKKVTKVTPASRLTRRLRKFIPITSATNKLLSKIL